MSDVHATLDVLAALEVLAVSAKKIAKDGVNLADLPEALELLKHVDAIVLAVKEAKEVPAEIKDIDQAELIAVGSKVFALIKAVKEA